MPARRGLASPLINVAVVESIAVLRPLSAEFGAAEATEFNRIFRLLQRRGMHRLVVDLSASKTISSEGLGALSACWHYCHDKRKGQVSIALPAGPESETANLLEITGLQRVIGSALQRSVKDALNYVKTFAPAIQ